MSKMVDQIADVVKRAKDEILDEISKHGDIKTEDAVDIVKRQFKSVAGKYNVNESTIRDKCTRQMSMSTEEFAQQVVDHLTGKNQKLVNSMLDNCKNERGNDNKSNILNRMNSI